MLERVDRQAFGDGLHASCLSEAMKVPTSRAGSAMPAWSKSRRPTFVPSMRNWLGLQSAWTIRCSRLSNESCSNRRERAVARSAMRAPSSGSTAAADRLRCAMRRSSSPTDLTLGCLTSRPWRSARADAAITTPLCPRGSALVRPSRRRSRGTPASGSCTTMGRSGRKPATRATTRRPVLRETTSESICICSKTESAFSLL